MDPLAKVNPVKPPKVNKNKNPIAMIILNPIMT